MTDTVDDITGEVLVGRLFRRLFLNHRSWWPPPSKVLYALKAATVVLSIGASALMLIPAAAWQRQISAVMGIEGPATRDYLRTIVVALIVGGVLVSVARVVKDAIKFLARVMIRRWNVNDEVAMFIGTAIVVVLVITLVRFSRPNSYCLGSGWLSMPRSTRRLSSQSYQGRWSSNSSVQKLCVMRSSASSIGCA